MTLRTWIEEKLRGEFQPDSLTVLDESHQHQGHAGWREGGETHFRVHVVSQAFSGKSRLDRHRMVNTALSDAYRRGLHALAISAQAPGEAG